MLNKHSAILERIYAAFSDCSRPIQFVDETHCSECAEHNQTLIDADRETIGLDELGNPGWDPICFVDSEGFKYYFPALSRLALDESSKYEYLDQFLFHCTSGKHAQFNKEQTQAVLHLISYINTSLKKVIDNELLGDDIKKALRLWTSLENSFA
ncbi:DUF6714 family protein [Rubritalea sp.]|uniref:DUF6714 family protein n=1 Tax=Rubritalea sp. TaxID=2109375 RepID=UPI003EF479DE